MLRPRAGIFIACVLALAGASLAQEPRIDPLAITGEAFGPVRLESALSGRAVEDLSLAGQRAWAWEVRPISAGESSTHRVFIEGDVRLTIGTMEVRADRIHGWLQPVPEGGQQFFLLLEEARTPTGAAGVGIAGPLVPIEGRLAPGARLDLSGILIERGSPVVDRARARVLAAAESVFADRLREALGLSISEPMPLDVSQEDAALREVLSLARRRLGTMDARDPILPVRGRVHFSASGIDQVRLGDGSDGGPPYAIVLRGPVTIFFDDTTGGRRAQLTAQNAVVFHRAEMVGAPRLEANDVMGIYLEGEVVADIEREQGGRAGGVDRYRVRSPRVYYDLANDRAVLLEAVFRAEPAGSPVPIYIRAREIRQESMREVRAKGARLTTTGFFRPHLSLGASSVTLRLRDRADGRTRMVADARNITARAAGVPFLYWPIYVGDPTQIPLRNIGYETSRRHGEVIRTTWDGFALVGTSPPAGVDLDLLIDAYFRRGPAFGGELRWNGDGLGRGNLFVYNVINDTYRDLLPTGARIDRDGENRTVALLEHIGKVDQHWTLRAEGAWFSDENVVGSFFPTLAMNRREPITGASLQRIDDSSVLLLSVQAQTNDFVVSDYQLRSRGSITERLPELRYVRPGDDLLPEAAPGMFTYSSDSRVGQLRFGFTEPTAAELGFTSVRRAQAALGVLPGQSPGDRLRAQGLDESAVFRFDTKHELSGQFDLGAVRVQPFVTGRVTAYDDDFDDFSAASGRDADSLVASGAAGVRFSTQLTRVYNGVDVPALDLYRLRHVIEPSATLWYGDSTVAQGAMPVYDEHVENVARGPALRFGVDQTFQTMRGSLGAYESVDVLRLSTHAVFAGDDRPEGDRTPRFFDAYPERSQFGDSLDFEAAWRPTDAIGVTGQLVYDLEASRTAESVLGVEIDQGPDVRLFGELRRIGFSNDTFINAGVDYKLGDRYTLGVFGVYNERAGDFQSATFRLGREMPNLIITGRLTYNDISGETSLGFDLQPTGVDPRQQQIDRLGRASLGF